MFKYLLIIACFGFLACGTNAPKETTQSLWQFVPSHHNSILDHNSQPIINKYQDVLKGLQSKDSFYLHQSTRELIQICDSLAALNLIKDSLLQKTWVDGLNNIHSELAGVLLAEDPKELNIAVHMSGIQILNLLAQIGYKEHSIYIFNAEDPNFEDGFVWFGLQKTAHDPFHSDKHIQITATQLLQE